MANAYICIMLIKCVMVDSETFPTTISKWDVLSTNHGRGDSDMALTLNQTLK